MGGAQQQPEAEDVGPAQDSLAQLLQGFMGGQPQQASQTPSSAQDPLAQMLQGFMGGQTSQGYQAPQAYAVLQAPEPVQEASDLGGLLGGLFGGGGLTGGGGQVAQGYGSQAGIGSSQGAPNMGGLLQALLGGGLTPAPAPATQASGGLGLGNILGSILGGGSQAMASDSFLAPIVARLAEKIGLPPQVAQAVVAFVIGKLMESRMQPGLDSLQADVPSRSTGTQPASLEDVVARMNTGKRVPKTAIRRAGLAQELSAHTGLNRATAEASVQEVLNALGGQLGTGV